MTPNLPNIRPDVADAVRRAARLSYVHSRESLSMAELATALGTPQITPAVLEAWARADDWDGLRRDAHSPDELIRQDCERRRFQAQASMEALHTQTQRVLRVLRPKTWEGVAALQMRCAEALRAWALEDARRGAGTQEEAKPEEAAAAVPDPLGELDEKTWQEMAHVALSARTRGPDGTADEGTSQ